MFVSAMKSWQRQSWPHKLRRRKFGPAVVLAAAILGAGGAGPAAAGEFASVRFDVPQVATATPLELPQSPQADPSPQADHSSQPGQSPQADPVAPSLVGSGEMLVSIDLTISVIVQSLSASPVDQLLIEIKPLGGTAIVADYAPRTELASEYSGGIEIQKTDEVNHSLGLALDACYPPLATGKLSGGKGEKSSESTKYSRVAPLHLIAASGTTQRGRGVYFKFRSTDQQIIEGDRQLSLTLRVPASWRGELLEVLIRGERQARGFSVTSLTGGEPRAETVGLARFLVASYRGDDPQGRQLARRLADAETEMRMQLRAVNAETLVAHPLRSPAALLRHVSHRIDWNASSSPQHKATMTLHRALAGTLDPHRDRDFQDLPVDARVSCLNYLDARQEYLQAVR